MGKVLDEPKYAVVDPAPSASKIGEHRRGRDAAGLGTRASQLSAAGRRHPTLVEASRVGFHVVYAVGNFNANDWMIFGGMTAASFPLGYLAGGCRGLCLYMSLQLCCPLAFPSSCFAVFLPFKKPLIPLLLFKVYHVLYASCTYINVSIIRWPAPKSAQLLPSTNAALFATTSLPLVVPPQARSAARRLPRCLAPWAGPPCGWAPPWAPWPASCWPTRTPLAG